MRHYSPLGLGLLVAAITGCSSPAPEQNMAGSPAARPAAQASIRPAAQADASGFQPAGSSSSDNPEIRAGQCWVYSQIRPRKIETTTEITLKDSSARISVTPAEIRQGYQQVVTREGTRTYRIEPPVYRKVTERVMVRPEMTRFVVVPAVYETRPKPVVVEAPKTVLEPCQTAGTRYAKDSGARGFCARETPGREETVNVQVLVQPETTRAEFEPAVYEEVTRWVVERPAQAVEITTDPSVTSIPVQEVVRPEQTRQTIEPPVTREMSITRFEGAAQMVSRQAVCNSDITPQLIHQLQVRLAGLGFNPGRPDGLLGERTIAALTDYQTENGLAIGALTFETLDNLGISH